MVVNSFSFLFFFIVVFIVYYLPIIRKNKNFQNVWLLLSSYFFYGYADWKMIPLLLTSTIVFYLIGLYLKKCIDEKKWKRSSWLTTLGVCLGVLILVYFKYLNFFADSIGLLINAIGFNVSWTTLNIIVPIGVSFFTFKLIGYIIDIYQESIIPSNNFIEFATYISFFPTILSGPIDRPTTFLPQFKVVHQFDYPLAVDGCRQILWGMFIKMCIADNLLTGTNMAWEAYEDIAGFSLLVLAFLYFIQLYCDFSGYSHMAIGVGKLLGFRITRNFNHPLLARNVAEYWRRWHMSLTSWITDYIYMPLNFSFRKYKKVGSILAVLVNLTIIGLWHGANWTYVVFGLYYGILFIPLVLDGAMNNNKVTKINSLGLPSLLDFIKMCVTFVIVSFGALIFRAPSITELYKYCSHIFSNNFFQNITFGVPKITILFILILFVLEWVQRFKEHELQFSYNVILKSKIVRWFIYIVIFFSILAFHGNQAQFIYFQF